ncbi:hypothetical protein VTJ49DRAFT_3274 [Mycothermus thermophilus]|uniref:Uncharacterized protein n=1 Tax=Humicola insolens TaxID=85995 RepID=A0ABR3V864_HUMIN
MAGARSFLANLFFLSTLLISVSVVSGNENCLDRNGDPDLKAARCWHPEFGATGLCCHVGDLCVVPGFCITPTDKPVEPFKHYPGTCVNGKWDNPNCTQWCANWRADDVFFDVCQDRDDPKKYHWFCKRGTWDRDRTADTCDEKAEIVVLPKFIDDYATAGVSPTSTETFSGDDDETTTATETSGTTTTSLPATPTEGTDNNNDDDDNPSSNIAVPIGIGIAIGSTLLLATSALLFFYIRKKRRSAPRRAETPPAMDPRFVNSQAPDWIGPVYGQQQPKDGPAELGDESVVVGRGVGELDGSPVMAHGQRGMMPGGPLGSSPVDMRSPVPGGRLGSPVSVQSEMADGPVGSSPVVAGHDGALGVAPYGGMCGGMPGVAPGGVPGFAHGVLQSGSVHGGPPRTPSAGSMQGGMPAAGVRPSLVPGGGRVASGEIPMPSLPELP